MSTRGRYPKFQPPTHFEYDYDETPITVEDWDDVPRRLQPFRKPYRRRRKLSDVRAGAKIGRQIAHYQRVGNWDMVMRLIYRRAFQRPLFPRLTPLLSCLKKSDKTVKWGGSGIYFDVVVR